MTELSKDRGVNRNRSDPVGAWTNETRTNKPLSAAVTPTPRRQPAMEKVRPSHLQIGHVDINR